METVIADAGPLVAYLKRDDADHVWTREVFQQLTTPLLTCDAVLGEAFFLLQQTHDGTDRLIELVESGVVIPEFDLATEFAAVAQLLRKYESVPKSFGGCVPGTDGGIARRRDGDDAGRRFPNLPETPAAGDSVTLPGVTSGAAKKRTFRMFCRASSVTWPAEFAGSPWFSTARK